MKRTRLALAAAALVALAGAHAAADSLTDKLPERITEQIPEFQEPDLFIGDKAPDMMIREWVSGSPVTEFRPGHTYVVEFWATWCGPCIKAFPHLSELQAAHKDDLTIIGVNIWDRSDDEQDPAHTERISAFVDEQGKNMAYTVAIEDGTRMADGWMRPAGRNGIPSAFIVDGRGNIAWAGHPASMDATLMKVMEGSVDYDAARAAIIEEHKTQALFPIAMQHAANADTVDDAYMIMNVLADGPMKDNELALNWMAWTILTGENIAERRPEVAIKYATRACELSDWSSADILDTLALAHFEHGDKDKAIEYQTKAVELATDPQAKAAYEETLNRFKGE